MTSINEQVNSQFQNTILRFLTFVRDSWETVLDCEENDQFEFLAQNFLQANWELLVEGAIPIPESALEIYGDGADFGTSSSRVLFTERLPTHKVLCKPIEGLLAHDHLNDKNIDARLGDLVFDRFVTMHEGWHYERNPFDYVLAYYGDSEVVLKLEDIHFLLSEGGLDSMGE